jgi:hypothetical protein
VQQWQRRLQRNSGTKCEASPPVTAAPRTRLIVPFWDQDDQSKRQVTQKTEHNKPNFATRIHVPQLGLLKQQKRQQKAGWR